MTIEFPHIKQDDLDYAIRCLESCKQDNAIEYGFPYPYFAPAAHMENNGGSWILL